MVYIRHLDTQIPILMHTPLHTPLEYLKDTFQTTRLVVATDSIKAAKNDSDYAWSHSLRNKLPCFLVYCNAELCDLISPQLLMLGVSIMSNMTSLSIDINVHDHETSDHLLTNELVN